MATFGGVVTTGVIMVGVVSMAGPFAAAASQAGFGAGVKAAGVGLFTDVVNVGGGAIVGLDHLTS